jgi:hypothetical protein
VGVAGGGRGVQWGVGAGGVGAGEHRGHNWHGVGEACTQSVSVRRELDWSAKAAVGHNGCTTFTSDSPTHTHTHTHIQPQLHMSANMHPPPTCSCCLPHPAAPTGQEWT